MNTSPSARRRPSPDAWYRDFATELATRGLPDHEADAVVTSTRAEAEATGTPPGKLYGPAVLYAREVASALRIPASAGNAPAPIPAAPTTPAGPVVLRLSGVSARRGRRIVLHDVDLTVRRGEIVAVVGANGAGKSTMLQTCAGLLRADGGTVERTARFGYAPQIGAL